MKQTPRSLTVRWVVLILVGAALGAFGLVADHLAYDLHWNLATNAKRIGYSLFFFFGNAGGAWLLITVLAVYLFSGPTTTLKRSVAALGRGMACIVLMGTLTACASQPAVREPRVLPRTEGTWAGLVVSDRKADTPFPFVGGINLCLDWEGSVEVVEVTMEHTDGELRVDSFGLRPHVHYTPELVLFEYPEPSTFTETLAELGFAPGANTIDTVCPEDMGGPSPRDLSSTIGVTRGLTGLGIQFSKGSDESARGAVIRLSYRSAGGTEVYRIGFELILCEHDDSDLPDCAFRDYDWEESE